LFTNVDNYVRDDIIRLLETKTWRYWCFM